MTKKSKFQAPTKISVPLVVLKKHFVMGETVCRFCNRVIDDKLDDVAYSMFDNGVQVEKPIFAHKQCAMTHDAAGLLKALCKMGSKNLNISENDFKDAVLAMFNKEDI